MNKNLLSELTVVILTYKTNREVLSNCLKSLDEKVKVKIIENSEYFENEKEFINKFSNLTIECTGKNLGFGGGNNFGFKKINTKFVLALSPDTICDKNFFENIKSYLKDSLEFSLIGVSYYQNESFPTYGYFNKSKKISIVGHSQGCLVGMEYASRYPEKIMSVSLITSGYETPVNSFLLDAAENNPEIAVNKMISWGFGEAGHMFQGTIPGNSMLIGGYKTMFKNPLHIDLHACNNYKG